MNNKISYKVPIIIFIFVIAVLAIIIWFGLKEIRGLFSDEVEIREYPKEYPQEIPPYIPFETNPGEDKG